jgi:eukaryotic-like serine/threonine-protein kinase
VSDPSRGDEFDMAAESFLGRLRAGERPSITEYALRHPDLADEIRELFPALVEMEEIKHDRGSSTGPGRPRRGTPVGVGVPDRLGDYRISRAIGMGGMGVVYEAERESLRAPVALKVLHPRYRDDREFRRRFRNEARSAARLHHNNIVPVFDFGDHDGVLFCVMQYIPGQPLDRILDGVKRLGGEVGPEADVLATTVPDAAGSSHLGSLAGSDQLRYHREVARIGAEVAGALSYAHGRGVLHRDVKPSNLLIDSRGTPWITDFGLAKFEGGEDLTATGDIVGTIRYMAPERFEGRSDARCDIYALGVTLYEMLALRPAFEGPDRAGLIRRIMEACPTPLRRLDPRISRDMETVVHKAMARCPSDRYASAAELAEELRRVVENRPIRARRLPPHEQLWRWCRRNPLVAGLSASAATLTLLVAILSTAAAVHLRHNNAEVREHLRRAEAAETQRAEQLWEAKLAKARAVRFSRRSGQRLDSLAAIAEAASLGRELGHSPGRIARLRNEAIADLALPDIQITEQFGRWTADIVSVDVDDDFELYATSDDRGGCIVRRIEDDSEVARLPVSVGKRRVTFGPGRWLADHDASGTGHWRLWDLAGPSPIARIEVGRPVLSWDHRPDGRLVTLAHADGSLATYDLPTGRPRGLLPPRPIPKEPLLRLHPTAPFLVVTSYFSRAFEIRHVETGETLTVEPPWPGGRTYPCDWSRDGRLLAIPGPESGKVALYEFGDRPPAFTLLRTIPLFDSTSTVAFNEAGDRLFGRGWAGVTFMLDVNTGLNLFATKAFNFPLSRWTARVLGTDKTRGRLFPGVVDDPERRFAYWSVAEGRECRLMVPSLPHGGGRDSGIGADGRMAMGVSGGRVVFFDLGSGREAGSITLTPGPSGIYAGFDRSGHLLTNSRDGCYRWPVVPDPSAPGTFLIGPPEPLDLDPGSSMIASSRDGRIVAEALFPSFSPNSRAGGLLLDRRGPGGPRDLAPGVPLGNTTVSPDGRWVAFEGSPGPILVFDVETGKQVWGVKSLVGRCMFSPDGKWLATGGDNGRLYAAGTWEPGPRLGPGYLACFSVDGATAVLSTGQGPFRLVEVATGRELARFEDPDWDVEQVSMSPDGGTLVATHKAGLRVWDLRLIRAGLARLGLDWDAPALPPRKVPGGPFRVEIVGADLLAR